MKPARRKRGIFSLPAMRRREIERHAKHVGAHDLRPWLVAWVWHNDQNKRDPVGALRMVAARMGNGILSEAEATEILASADDMRQHRTADRLARFLGVTYAQRQRLAITTIGATDVSKKGRLMLRKHKDRERKRRKRNAQPRAEYEAQSLTRSKPWQAAGMSRATWYRKRRAAKAEQP